MHRYNNKYGYASVLRHYCAVADELPIWGEIQHSLFLNTRYYTADGRLGPPREQLQRFPRLLSWNTILPFPHQVPIGDPLWYFLETDDQTTWPQLPLETTVPPVVVMPKLNDEVAFPDRLDHYDAVLREAGERFPGMPRVLSLHPREVRHRADIEARLASHTTIVWREGSDHLSDLRWSLSLLSQADALVSDYFGAHAFRATAFFDTPVALTGDVALNHPGYHEDMRVHLQGFVEATGDLEAQREISHLLLGRHHRRSVSELTEILGFTGWKRLLARPARAVYRTLRRQRVHCRQRLGQQSQ